MTEIIEGMPAAVAAAGTGWGRSEGNGAAWPTTHPKKSPEHETPRRSGASPVASHEMGSGVGGFQLVEGAVPQVSDVAARVEGSFKEQGE